MKKKAIDSDDPLMIETPLKRRLKEAAAKAEPIKIEERVSFYGKKYPDSAEKDWAEYKPLGFVHATEISKFEQNHFKCELSKHWCPSPDAIRKSDHYGRGLVSRNKLKEFGWGICDYSYRATPVTRLAPAMSDEAKPIMISVEYRDAFFIKYDDGHYYCSDSMLEVSQEVEGEVVRKRHPKHVCNKVKVSKCDCCGRVWMNEFILSRPDLGPENQDYRYCPVCYMKKLGATAIREYNYNGYPKPIKKLERKYEYGDIKRVYPVRLFGVEIETEMSKPRVHKAGLDRWAMAMEVKKALGLDFVVAKEDGTLITNGKYSEDGNKFAGFEVVTAPACLATMRERLPKLELAPHYKFLRAWDCTTCGLHVHVSRESLTTLQIGRIIAFVTHPKNKAFIQKVAGRGELKFCAYHPKKVASSIGIERRSDETRRVAVNTTNPNTIEFRIFRGTVNTKHILRNVEFADSLCDYCHPASRSLQELFTDDGYVKFVLEARAIGEKDEPIMKWPLLAAWFVANSMGDKSKLIGPIEEVPEMDGFQPDTTERHDSNYDPLGLKLVKTEAYAAKKIAKKEVRAAKPIVHASPAVQSYQSLSDIMDNF